MNDDFAVLRATMHDLAERGGDTDLHDRMLRASRRLGRRRRLAGTAAVAVAIVAVTTPFALAGTRQATPAPDVVAPPPSASPSAFASPSPSPSVSPSAPISPSTSPPASTSRPATSSGPAGRTTTGGRCPVTSKTLIDADKARGRQPDPGDRYRSIECHSGYVTAAFEQETPVGDPGDTVFAYRKDRWVALGSGTAELCGSYLPRGLWTVFDFCGDIDPSQPCRIGSAEAIDALRHSEFSRGIDEVSENFFAVQLACNEKYAVVELRKRTTYAVLSWNARAQRWSVVDAGPCRQIVLTKYADPAICG